METLRIIEHGNGHTDIEALIFGEWVVVKCIENTGETTMSEEFDPTNYKFRNGDKSTGEFEIEEGRTWYGAIDKNGSIYQTEEIPVYFAPRINLFSASFDEQYALAKSIGDKRFGSECKHDKTFSKRCVKCLRKTR